MPWIQIPPGVVHSVANHSASWTQLLIWCAPGGIEAYFAELSELLEGEPTWPPHDPCQVIELARRYDQYPAEELKVES